MTFGNCSQAFMDKQRPDPEQFRSENPGDDAVTNAILPVSDTKDCFSDGDLGKCAWAGIAVTPLKPLKWGKSAVTGIKGLLAGSKGGKRAAETAVAGERAVAIGPAPENAWKVLESVGSRNSSLPGYKGGGAFANDGRAGSQVLPRATSAGDAVKYQEWDVNSFVKGVNRGTERLVTGSDGSAFYTNDHYLSFVQFR